MKQNWASKYREVEKLAKSTAFTAGKRVAKVDINGKEISGKDIREKLGLMSTDFTWERKGDKIVINTQGYGHGVGMSHMEPTEWQRKEKNMKTSFIIITKVWK